MALHFAKPKHRSITNPSLIHLFSTSSTAPPPPQEDDSTTEKPSQSSSSYFSDVKASLKQSSQYRSPISQFPRGPPPRTEPSPTSSAAGTTIRSLEEIRKNLSEFRRPQSQSQSQPQFSLQELYKKNVAQSDGYKVPADSTGANSFAAVRESLGNFRTPMERRGPQPVSVSSLKDSLRMRPNDNSRSRVIGTETLPASIFGGRKSEKRSEGDSEAMKTEFLKMYSCGELGDKLRKLRPEGEAKKQGFSLQELNERLMKLREMEEKETERQISGVSFKDLRHAFVTMQVSDEERKKQIASKQIDVLGQLGRTPNYMPSAPKEHLVEKYFHPDNMSAAEKMKIQLAQVREEFKMSESDVGSSRVQVAQLTTKIKHLSGTLHKKDKHSRKGLVAMVQKRKKLLKYMRRTDWDSYCFVISKLGLRDNPDYKH